MSTVTSPPPDQINTAQIAGTFQAGGALPPDHPSYVVRPTDDVLFNLVLANEYAYILTPRQMGKTSLVYRCAKRLKDEGLTTLRIDLSSLGTPTVEHWYFGLLYEITDQLNLEIDLQAWWQKHQTLGPVQRFNIFIQKVLLTQITTPIVIFIDEIDKTLQLPFSDDFFAAIRAFYNARADTPALTRLSFVLLGVASPTDLIKDPTQTPFNIGQELSLQDFEIEATTPLKNILQQTYHHQAKAIFNRIHYWTDGHPFLTQKLCQAVIKSQQTVWTDTDTDTLVENTFFKDKIQSDSHLKEVQSKLLTRPQKIELLRLYKKIYQSQSIKHDPTDLLQIYLKMSGVVKANAEGYLQVRNTIYKQVFNLGWVEENLLNTFRYLLSLSTDELVILFVKQIIKTARSYFHNIISKWNKGKK